MKFQVVQLRFRQPIHLSRGKLNTYESSETMLHSDTLQAALFVCALQLYNEQVALELQQKVVLSSAFPFVGEDYYLPRPLQLRFDEDPDTRKALKKIRHLKKTHFEQVLRGERPSVDSLEEPEIWKNDVTQRVFIDRINAESTPFYLEKLYPVNNHQDRGFYVLIENKGFDKLPNLFKLLGDNGIGLQRGLGNGSFEAIFQDTPFTLELPEKVSAWVNISLYRPSSETEAKSIQLENSHYQLIKRGGWLSSPENTEHMSLRKKSVLMFAEGSVLAFNDGVGGVRGKVEETQPRGDVSHPVYRDGRGIFLPMKQD